ncbi:hypothetical protein NC652_018842 [Populus alba x Populus x berolinensis]|nr:hypothetical protein NC652_018842 [Populus alba x Populus x berolinensis]
MVVAYPVLGRGAQIGNALLLLSSTGRQSLLVWAFKVMGNQVSKGQHKNSVGISGLYLYLRWQVAIDSATPIDDAGPSGNFMMSGPEPFGSYAGPMRNFGRMYGTLDYDDASAYMVPSKWGYGMGSARPSRADWRYRPY